MVQYNLKFQWTSPDYAYVWQSVLSRQRWIGKLSSQSSQRLLSASLFYYAKSFSLVIPPTTLPRFRCAWLTTRDQNSFNVLLRFYFFLIFKMNFKKEIPKNEPTMTSFQKFNKLWGRICRAGRSLTVHPNPHTIGSCEGCELMLWSQTDVDLNADSINYFVTLDLFNLYLTHQ